MFAAFLPAVSRQALVEMGRQVRRWRIHLRVGGNLADLARWVNPIVRGWMQYYGWFYRTMLHPLLLRCRAGRSCPGSVARRLEHQDSCAHRPADPAGRVGPDGGQARDNLQLLPLLEVYQRWYRPGRGRRFRLLADKGLESTRLALARQSAGQSLVSDDRQ